MSKSRHEYVTPCGGPQDCPHCPCCRATAPEPGAFCYGCQRHAQALGITPQQLRRWSWQRIDITAHRRRLIAPARTAEEAAAL